MSSQDTGFVGFIVSIDSYTQARAIVYNPSTSILRYGALALVNDVREGKRFLALVEDVREHSLLPAVDEERLERLNRILATRGARYEDAARILQQLFSPTSSLIRWYSARELSLRILGEIRGEGGSVALSMHSQPPRPTSMVAEPDEDLLVRIISRGLGERGIFLGSLVYHAGINASIDPLRLNTHLAVVGQTGSGKTETVKRIVAEYAWRKNLFSDSGGVVVFDVTGEYTGHPYRPIDSYPLLDAVLYASSYTDLPADWARSSNKTIVVAYDLAVVPMKAEGEVLYAREVAGFVEALARIYGVHGPVSGLVYARYGIYLVGGSRPPINIGRDYAARILREEPFIVVAAPLPDILGVEEVVEISGSRSEYFEIVVHDMAEALGILELHGIAGIRVLSQIADIADTLYRVQRSRERRDAASIARLVGKAVEDAARQALRSEPSRRCGVFREALKDRLGMPWLYVDCEAWSRLLAYPEVKESPETRPWESLEAVFVEDSEWRRELVNGLVHAASILLEQESRTIASVRRGLRKVARLVSPVLDQAHYRLLARRVIEGFSIVHLAPPSRGDTDLIVSRLLSELFSASIIDYNPRRRSLVVVEEAHNLAPADEDRYSGRILLRIAREGRKWGLGLVLVSQRPGFIDPSILSQAATIIALRITNPEDLSGLRRSVESVSQEVVSRLPDLDPGQALVSGLAVPERRIPLLVRVERIEPKRRRGDIGARPSERELETSIPSWDELGDYSYSSMPSRG